MNNVEKKFLILNMPMSSIGVNVDSVTTLVDFSRLKEIENLSTPKGDVGILIKNGIIYERLTEQIFDNVTAIVYSLPESGTVALVYLINSKENGYFCIRAEVLGRKRARKFYKVGITNEELRELVGKAYLTWLNKDTTSTSIKRKYAGLTF